MSSDLADRVADPGSTTAPAGFEIALWILDYRRATEGRFQAFESCVSAEERRRARAFSDARLRERYLLDHGFLRAVLARYVTRGPVEIPIARTPFGKPYVAHPSADGLRFNMSHAGELTLVAVAFGFEIGVDVEALRRDVSFEDVAESCFSPREVQALAALRDDQKPLGFFTIWARKEALVKALGEGISTDFLRSLDVGAGPAGTVTRDGRCWRLQHVALRADYVAALAAAGEVRRVVHRQPGALALVGQHGA